MSAWTTFGVGQIIKITVLGRTANGKIYVTMDGVRVSAALLLHPFSLPAAGAAGAVPGCGRYMRL